LFRHVRRRPTQCRASRAVSMRRLANPFAVAHASRQRLDRLLAGPVKASPPRERTRLPSKGAFRRPTPCDACRVWSGTWSVSTRARLVPLVLPPVGPRTTPLHRYDAVLLWANTVVSARPPFTPAYLIDCGCFFGPDAASRLLQRVFNDDTRAHTRERRPRPT